MSGQLESSLERSFVNYVQSIGGKAMKWVCPSCTGVPDRIVLLPGGQIIFVELKRPGRKEGRSPRQKKVAKQLEDLGFKCWLINDLEVFKKRLREEVIINDFQGVRLSEILHPEDSGDE